MTKRIVLHCGLGKTGSSALQVQFAKSRDAIIEKLGFDYIQTGAFEDQLKGKISSGNGVHLARAFLPASNPSSLSEEQDAVTANAMSQIRQSPHHVLLSSEYFGALPAPQMRGLVDVLQQEGAVELVFFVRNQISLLSSIYMQRVKRHGETRLPAEFFQSFDQQRKQFFYMKKFSKLRDFVPDIALRIGLYEESETHPQGLIGLFLSLAGMGSDVDLDITDAPVNTSPSPLELRLMLEINRFSPRMQFSDMLVEASAQAGRSSVHGHPSIFPPRIRRRIKRIYEADNEAFFKTFLDRENAYTVKVNADYVDLETLAFEPGQVLSILSGLMSKMDHRIAALEKAMQSP